MSRFGEITVECHECHAVEFVGPSALSNMSLGCVLIGLGWLWDGQHDVCPECVEEDAMIAKTDEAKS